MKKVLVGFDGSQGARDALPLGNAFAELEDAKLVVLAVFPFSPLPVQANTFAEAEAQYFKERFRDAQQQLGHGFESRSVSWASPAKALNDLAEDEEIDLIVIGSTHRGSVGRVLPGSVGERLLNGAPCAVAVAPRGFARREHFGLGLVGVAYDGTAESELALHMKVIREQSQHALRSAAERIADQVEVEPVFEEDEPAAVLARHGV